MINNGPKIGYFFFHAIYNFSSSFYFYFYFFFFFWGGGGYQDMFLWDSAGWNKH